jgi:hypothetical protein
VQANAQSLPLGDACFDACVSGLMLNFLSEPRAAMSESIRVVRSRGTVAAYVWDFSGEMQMLRLFWDAAITLDPSAATCDQGAKFPLCFLDNLVSLFEQAGLAAIEHRAVDIATRFRDFDDYWEPLVSGSGSVPDYALSLPADRLAALRDLLDRTLPRRPDGSIELRARAWAIQGRVAR